jgi:hypothetical protein
MNSSAWRPSLERAAAGEAPLVRGKKHLDLRLLASGFRRLFVEEVENHVDVQANLSGHRAIPRHQLVNEPLDLSEMLGASGPDDLGQAARHSTERIHPYPEP